MIVPGDALATPSGDAGVRIVVTGSSGLIGTAVVRSLRARGDDVQRLVRRAPAAPDETFWDPAANALDAAKLAGTDAIVHLAGVNVATHRWNARRKTLIRDSRVCSTRLLSETIAALAPPPPTLICASGVSYYGHDNDRWFTESDPPGTGFLADVCRQWEAAAEPARAAGIRVVHLRIGVVLSTAGGALPRMLKPVRLGLGGPIGSGRQFMSWITLDDLVRVVAFVLDHHELRGPVNAVAPQPVTNREFMRALGRVLHRPVWLPLPAFAVRMALGEMGRELLLGSLRVRPARLLDAAFDFACPAIEPALRQLLGP